MSELEHPADTPDSPAEAPGEFTRLLHAASAGDREAFDAAFASAYRELHARTKAAHGE